MRTRDGGSWRCAGGTPQPPGFSAEKRIHPPPPARRKRHIACDEFFYKTRRALILLLLAFTAQTLRWFVRRWMRGCRFFIKTSSARFLAPPGPNRIRYAGLRFGGLRRVFLKLVVRSFCCSSLSPRKHFAGLHGDGCGVAVFL